MQGLILAQERTLSQELLILSLQPLLEGAVDHPWVDLLVKKKAVAALCLEYVERNQMPGFDLASPDAQRTAEHWLLLIQRHITFISGSVALL